MKRLLPKACLLSFLLAFQPGLAQEESGQEAGEQEETGQDAPAAGEAQPADPQTETGGNEQAGDASPESPEDISRAFEDFVPSAQVSEDLSVAFPVDI